MYIYPGFIPEPPTYLNDFQGVYVAAIGTGFYQQCVPSNSVDLAFSSTAAHWLSKRSGCFTIIFDTLKIYIRLPKRLYVMKIVQRNGTWHGILQKKVINLVIN